MTSALPYHIGLDLGTNSIGWAAFFVNENGEPNSLIDAGVRIFSDGRENAAEGKIGESLAVKRRTARGMRRRRDRFLQRKEVLMNYLMSVGLMPKAELERKKLTILNPYELRTKALDEALNPHELGRALFHLNQRRGFKSNRKNVSEEAANEANTSTTTDKKPKKLSQADHQNLLKQKIAETKSRTLGEFFYKHRLAQKLTTRAKEGEDGLYPTRDLYENEFAEIKKSQAKHQKISDENWQRIHEIIFHQRPLAPQEKGVCQLLNKHTSNLPSWAQALLPKDKKGLPRAALALPSYMKFRILSEVNNLKITDKTTGDVITLTNEQKQKIINKLNEQKTTAIFKSLRKVIGYASDNYEFNFEGKNRKGFDGNSTAITLSADEFFGKKWHDFPLQKQDEIVEFLLEKDEQEIASKATTDWKLSAENSARLSKMNVGKLKQGYGNLSREILQKLCEVMERDYCRYDEATAKLGIDHSNQDCGDGSAEKLKYYGEVLPASTMPVKDDFKDKKGLGKDEKEFGRIANPTVHVALNQLQKVINALIESRGRPSSITVELARELKMSKNEKNELAKSQRKNEDENKDIVEELGNLGQRNSYNNRLKYKLWKELCQANNEIAFCPYSGKTIGQTQLFSHEVEIEHILPYSKTLDDGFANKTLAYRSANQTKLDKSPHEAFGSDAVKYQEILARVKNLPKNKRWRFEPEAMKNFADQNQFHSRQLNDTRYLSRLAKQYLAQICEPNNINVGNGKVTALLRHQWGLNSILNKVADVVDGETGEVLNAEAQKNVKKSRNDHRHHAVDAVVIGLTNRTTLQKISHLHSRGYRNHDQHEIAAPWENFRSDVECVIGKIVVSHKPDHGKNGQFHEETYYGSKEGEPKKISRNPKAKIADKSGVKIEHKQTVYRNNNVEEVVHYKYVQPGSNHHVAFWKLPKGAKDNARLKENIERLKGWMAKDGSYCAIVPSVFDYNRLDEAALRPHPAAKLLAKIHNGDLVRLKNDGREVTAIVRKLVPSADRIVMSEHNEANAAARTGKGKELKEIGCSFSAIKEKSFRKIFISPDGKVYDSEPILK
jgi:CRISPR-associated endonuclease Csn1